MKGGASCPHHWTPQMDLQMWPIYLKAIFAAHVLATLPATAMHKKYICHNSWAVWTKVWWGAVYIPLTILAPFWQENGSFPNLLQFCRFPAFKHLHDNLMLQSRVRGRGSGRCVQWVTLLQPDVGANTGNAIHPQPMHACKPDQAWGLQAIKDNLRNLERSQSRVRVGRGGPKCSLTSASSERTDQRQSFPCPHAQIHTGYAGQFYTCAGTPRSEFGAVREKVCTVQTWQSVFPRFPSTHRINFKSNGSIRTRKNQALQRCAQVGRRWGGGKVILCKVTSIKEPIWPPLPKEGVTQWWGRPAT